MTNPPTTSQEKNRSEESTDEKNRSMIVLQSCRFRAGVNYSSLTCTCLNYDKMASRTVSFRACSGVAFGKTDCPYREEGESPAPDRIIAANSPKGIPQRGLGDYIAEALSIVGITESAVQEFLGEPCGCAERKERMNQLGFWAVGTVKGKLNDARKYLLKIIGKPEET